VVIFSLHRGEGQGSRQPRVIERAAELLLERLRAQPARSTRRRRISRGSVRRRAAASSRFEKKVKNAFCGRPARNHSGPARGGRVI
jgi:hypothetical protein